ncbi:hypothetical protein AKJ09_09718 [Labilithrix luteola]|uniref:Tetratricopeptide repeat protein n=1 Tax=Labilithrix luteola TaxID=1391654 RepID=A0A0K1QC94_9BACT|nr:tetratricopeptide repeat protein [Labilithrix luteola]AKV03055.1 hypothetical protein AKJ09_09718 [Labilithrix luteola]
MKRASALLLAALVGGACAPNRGEAYEKSLAEARRAIHAGHFDQAATHFDEASKSARIPRDAVYTRYEAALAWARSGNVGRARSELHAIAQARPASEYSAQAAYKAAELTLGVDEEAGYRELEQVIIDYPQSGVARVALGRILRHDEETGGEAAALARLERLAPRIVEPDKDPKNVGITEAIVYERAKRLADQGKTVEARDAMLDVANRWPYPFGAYFDDALFRASELESKLGHPQKAIEHLERLLSHRESSSMLGTYERPRYSPAMFRIADIYENDLHDRGKTRETLHRFYKEFTTSPRRAEALWREADLWRKDGNTEVACDRLATLTKEFPDSRYVPCAPLDCPNLKRPEKSKAPKECHAYITREPGSERSDP